MGVCVCVTLQPEDTTNTHTHTHTLQILRIYTVKLGYSNIGFCDTLSIASNIQWYALIPYKAYSFITTLFLGPFDDVITKFYCICSLMYTRKDLYW
jgi:hypothetical protein